MVAIRVLFKTICGQSRINRLHTNYFGCNRGISHQERIYTFAEDETMNLNTNPITRPLVICGPSGCGKSTIVQRLITEWPQYIGFSVSHTTRKARKGETDGREYYFIDVEKMKQMIAGNQFIEYTQYAGNIYGTSKKSVKDVQDENKICILDVEINGVQSLMKSDLNARFVFLRPPDLMSLEERLRARNSESEKDIRQRLKNAQSEMDFGTNGFDFDLVIVNDDLEKAYTQLRDFIYSDIETLKRNECSTNHSNNFGDRN